MTSSPRRRPPRWAMALSTVGMATVLAATGCTAAPAPPPAGATIQASSPTGTLAGSTPPDTSARTSPAPPGGGTPGGTAYPSGTGTAPGLLTLALAGDVHFERHVRRLLDPGNAGLASLRPVLATADVAVVNLESAITERGTPQPKEFHFRASARALDVLAEAGVDVVGMANNHAVDFGSVGLADTLQAQAASPVPVIGVGVDERAAFAPAVLRVRGLSVAVLASTQVPDHTAAAFPAGARTPGIATNRRNDRLLAAVRQARSAHDIVVVFLHWGVERQVCPDGEQRATAAALEAAGADVVVGAHSHRIQGSGWLGRTYVSYGLGNFVWWLNSPEPPASASGVLTVSIDEAAVRSRATLPRDQWAGLRPVVVEGRWTPLRISPTTGVPAVPGATDGAGIIAAWQQARACTNLRGTR